MADDYNLDYKSMFEEVSEHLVKQYTLYDQYCNLLREITECADEVSLLSKNILAMNISDQVAFLKINCVSAKLAKKLCEKYDYFAWRETNEKS